ncbi:MAG: glycosyltransferase family 39 protein [Ignavibacteria bacterium]|nr:glycosyltransferase family 39 protein [Ignavibacteria bacterium]
MVYTIFQLLLLLRFPLGYSSDSKYFNELVQYCLQNNIFYPAPIHHYHDYLVAPFFVNLLILIMRIWNSQYTIGLFTILLNTTQLFFIFRLAERAFSRKTAMYTCLLFMFYLSNAAMVLNNFSDPLFVTLILGALYFYFTHTYTTSLLAGLLCGLSLGVRPFGMVMIIVILALGIINRKKEQFPLLNTSAFLAAAGVAILSIGLFTKATTGTFVIYSNYSGVNLIIGASDDARGGFQARVFDEGKAGYIRDIEKMPHAEREAYWMNQAVSWVKQHPIRWLLLAPTKIGRAYLSDDYGVSRIMFVKYSIYHTFRGIRDKEAVPAEDQGHGKLYFTLWAILLIIHHLIYFGILWLSYKGFRALRGSIKKNQLLIHFFSFCGLNMLIIMASYGEGRYKYPFMFLHFILAAEYLRIKFFSREEQL